MSDWIIEDVPAATRALKGRFPDAKHAAVGRAKVWAIFNVVTPVCARLMGYVPVDKLGVGKTIPLGVMLQWRRWASQGQYFFEDPEFDLAERFAKAEGPVLSVVMNDDLWVHRGAVDILTDRLDRADVVKRDIEEGEGTANGPVGHMGFYRSKHKDLWPEVAEWLEQRV